MQWSVAEWSPEYGDPHGFGEDDGGEPPQIWEHPAMQSVQVPRCLDRLGFVDGTRQLEARLYLETAQGLSSGLAGITGAGAVLPDAGGRLGFRDLRVERRVVLSGYRGQPPGLPEQAGGWRWQVVALESDEPQAAQSFLQQSMRDTEAEIAHHWAQQGFTVVLDGPLHGVALGDPRPGLIVGYVKTQHRRLFEGLEAEVITHLHGGERTSVFDWNQRRACYLRLVDGPGQAQHHPWFATVRLEVSQTLPRDQALPALRRAAGSLPRYCSEQHCDARAPQNLQPVAGLERELRRRAGDRQLGLRAIRQAVSHWSRSAAGKPRDAHRLC